jgi:hypothetical protein
MALADGVCVSREAMLLIALRYMLGIERDDTTDEIRIDSRRDVHIISCPTGDNTITNQYVIYIEGRHNEAVHNDINQNLELCVLKLRQWGFEFIFIPALIEKYRNMNEAYVHDVIRFMAPDLPEQRVDTVYHRLINMTTDTFCNQVLAEKLHVEEIKKSVPSLLINIGTSVIPIDSQSGSFESYTEFLSIPITTDFMEQVNEFLNLYCKLVSFTPVVSPIYVFDDQNYFRYSGFHKAMFDFIIKSEPKESDLVLHPYNSTFDFPQIASLRLVLSPQEAAFYKLVLECTYKHELGGLPTSYTKFQKDIEKLYRLIYRKRDAVYPDSFAPIRSHIERKMRKQLATLANIDDFIPTTVDGMYVVRADLERIKVSNGSYEPEVCFDDFDWETL